MTFCGAVRLRLSLKDAAAAARGFIAADSLFRQTVKKWSLCLLPSLKHHQPFHFLSALLLHLIVPSSLFQPSQVGLTPRTSCQFNAGATRKDKQPHR